MAKSVKIAIISGGLTHERDVSLRSGRRIAAVLRNHGFTVEVLDLDSKLVAELEKMNPDLVWPMVHGSLGEDGALQDLLELLGARYMGTGPAGARLASNKPVAKAILSKAQIATPEYVSLPQALFRQVGANTLLEGISSHYSYPLVVKPAQGGSALGVSRVRSDDELREAMVNAFAYAEEALVERMIIGTEVAVSVVQLDGEVIALPPVEVVTQDGPYDYDARYNAGRSEYFVPARLSAQVMEAAKAVAVQVHKELNLCDYSRTDLIVDEAGKVWFIDVNVTPGMTDTSLFPQAAAADEGFEELIVKLALSWCKPSGTQAEAADGGGDAGLAPCGDAD